jgi:predicted acetyltransferase
LALVGDPAARLALLRRLVDFDLMGSVKLRGVGLDDPILLWAGGPRSTSDVGTYDSLWVRLVDLPAALEQRTWSAACDVVVEVVDTTAPWNDGTWRIEVDETGRVAVEKSDASADVRLPASALGAAYLGGGNLVAMHQAGLLAEERAGAVASLWRAMRTDVLPTAAWMF